MGDDASIKGTLTMAAAHAMARAKVELAIAILEGREPEPGHDAADGGWFASWCGSQVGTIVLIRADRDPALMARLEAIGEISTLRSWWDFNTTDMSGKRGWSLADPSNDVGRILDEARLVRTVATSLMMDAMQVEILGGDASIRFCAGAPFERLADDDEVPVSRLADAPACEGPCVMALPNVRGLHALEAPSWRRIAELVDAGVAKARNPRGRYLDGVFPLDPRLHRGATHEVFLGS